MFDVRQQVFLQAAATAVIVFFIALVGKSGFVAAFGWGLVIGFVAYLVLRQNAIVTGRAKKPSGQFSLDLEPAESPTSRRPAPKPATAPPPRPSPAPATAAPPAESEQDDEGVRPPLLDKPRGGQADDLKRISGIGPKLEATLNDMGVFHFDQIASWGPDEVAWVDQAVTGFKGRASRDDWVAQAKDLMG